MPSWRAIASAVTAWSPVIIRTSMPAACAIAMAALASGRGGSTMPTRASSVRSLTSGSRSPRSASNVAGSKSRCAGRHDAQALAAEPLVLRHVRVRDLGRPGPSVPSASMADAGAREELVRGALDVQRTTSLPASSFMRVERGHELVGGVERDLRDARVALAGEVRVDAALGGEDDEGALGRIADERRRP